MDKKVKPLVLFCMVLLVVMGFFGFLSSLVVVGAPEPTPTVAIAEYDYYVVAGYNMTPTLPPQAPQPAGFTFTCTANNNATSTGYNFGSLDYHGGRDYLHDGCAETGSPYNDNAYVTVDITNNLGYTITIEDLTAEVTDGTSTSHWTFGWGPDWGMGNMTVIAVDTLDPWDPGSVGSYDEVNYNSGAVTVHLDPSVIVRDCPFGIVRGYPDWFRKATGIQGWPYLATQLGPGSLLENDLNGDAAATGHVKPVALANGATLTEYFGLTVFGVVDAGTQIDATITLRLIYTPPPEGTPAVCDVDIVNAVTVVPGYRSSDTIEVFNEWWLPVNVTVNNVGTVPLNGTVSGYYSLDKATWLSFGSSQFISSSPTNGTLLVFYWNLKIAGASEAVYFLKFNATATCENLTDTDEFLSKIKVRLLGDSDGDNKNDVSDQRKLELSMFSSLFDQLYLEYNSFPVFTDIDGDGDVDVGDQRKSDLHMWNTWPGPVWHAGISVYSPADSIALDPPTASISVNGTIITVTVTMTNITDCAGFMMKIDYDPTILYFNPYDPHSLSSWTFDTGTPLTPTQVAPAPGDRVDDCFSWGGNVRISTVWKAGVPRYSYAGSSVAAEITFQAISTGDVRLVFDKTWTHATDNTGNDILFQTYLDAAAHTLTINSSPTGVPFTADGAPHTTSWSGTYEDGASVNVVMPAVHTVGDERYYWDQWNDGNPSRSRTVTMTSNVTLTAYYAGPYYEFMVTSSPITGVPFTINGTPQTTPFFTEWLIEGFYTLEVPKLYGRHLWQRWLEDGDINRTKTVNINTTTTCTAVYELPPPVGGIYIPTNKLKLLAPYVGLALLLAVAAATVVFVKKRKLRRQ